jgi:hypothetical protein
MDKAAADRVGRQVRQAFPEGVITRVQVLQYGDDPEVEPGQAAVRAFFDWPGRAEGGKADPKTVHRFVTASAAALGVLRDGLPGAIGWAEFRPEGEAGAASPHSLSYRITDRGRPAAARDQAPEDLTPVMARLGAVDLATLNTLITATRRPVVTRKNAYGSRNGDAARLAATATGIPFIRALSTVSWVPALALT